MLEKLKAKQKQMFANRERYTLDEINAINGEIYAIRRQKALEREKVREQEQTRRNDAKNDKIAGVLCICLS